MAQGIWKGREVYNPVNPLQELMPKPGLQLSPQAAPDHARERRRREEAFPTCEIFQICWGKNEMSSSELSPVIVFKLR